MPKLYLLSIVVLFAACSKDTSSNADAAFSYRVNGDLNIITGSTPGPNDYAIWRRWPYSDTVYTFDALKSTNYGFGFCIMSSHSLSVGNYFYDSTYFFDSTRRVVLNYRPWATFYGEHWGSTIWWSGDYININITSNVNGLLSGTVTAKLSPTVLTAIDSGTLIIPREGQL